MKYKPLFPNELLADLRALSLLATLDKLGLYWKQDTDFMPIKQKETQRIHVSVEGAVFELLITGQKWYDARADKGGGGAIDLTMHLLRMDFVAAVKQLTSNSMKQLGKGKLLYV